MKLTDNCLDCLNAYEDMRMVNGSAVRVMVCEYMRPDFPHAKNCSTCDPETVTVRPFGIGDEICN